MAENTDQNIVYECSRGNATTKISNSEWINEWNEGIELKKGDTVRLLGSFVSEIGDGNDISIDNDVKFTMDFEPYINAETIKFPQTSTTTSSPGIGVFQMALGDIAQPAYYTDGFGTEPPYTTTDLQNQERVINSDSSHKRSVSDRFSYKKIYPGGIRTAYDFSETDDAVKAGAYFDTSSGTANLTAAKVTAEKLVDGTLGSFNQINLPHEYKIGHLCKLVSLPLFNGVKFLSSGGNYTNHFFDPLETLQVGDYISTYHIGNYPTLATATSTEATYPTVTNESFGTIKWAAGPQSVVGKIVATKLRTQLIYEPIDDNSHMMEFIDVYVQDFINPGQYKHLNDLDGAARAPRHGAPEKQNGYNSLRNNNKLNGVTNPQNNGGDFVETTPGQQTPLTDVNNYYVNNITQHVIDSNQELIGEDSYNVNMKGVSNAGLSFLWGAKGSFKLMDYNMPSSALYVVDAFTSWIEFNDDISPDWEYANAVNATDILVTDTFFYIGSFYSPQQMRESYINLNCRLSDLPNTFQHICRGIEQVAHQSEWAVPITAWTYWYKITLDTAIGVAFSADNMDVYFKRQYGGWNYLPKAFTYSMNETVSGDSVIDAVNSNQWNDVGGITQMNPNLDNTPYNEPSNPAYVKRFYIPFREQKVKSPYEVRNFGAGTWVVPQADESQLFAVNSAGIGAGRVPQDRRRYIFGTSPGWLGGGDIRNSLNRTIPFPYGLAGQTPYKFFLINAYNEQCCSAYFQNSNGHCIYGKQANDTGIETQILWQTDLIYTKKYKSEFNIPKGFYESFRMADIVNDQLHYDNKTYFQKIGINTNVGTRERALTDGNNVIHGNFIHTYIPELSFGFIPFTEEARINLNNPNFTQSITDCVNTLFKSYDDPLNPVLVANEGYNYYTTPYTHDVAENPLIEDGNLFLFRLIGSKIEQTQKGDRIEYINPSTLNNNRMLDILSTDTGEQSGSPAPGFIVYQNRGYKNRLMYGGAAKCWVGAVNPTFEFDNETNLYNWSFLYTPYRPAADESGNALTLVGGNAVPSAIINTIDSGEITESLSGIYITNLTSSQIDATNTSSFFDLFPNNSFPEVVPDYIINSQSFWNILGFSNNLITSYNTNTNTNPYIFLSLDSVNGDVLRNQAIVDISVNGVNPLKSYCSLWCPPIQYAVIVESDRKFGDARPKYASTPFYLIGSTFPSKEYYGGGGAKLPVIGVCSRQFSSFGFTFDLSESSITYTIDQDTKITSIRTKIYNNNFTEPNNLGPDSSVIYIISRNNYYPNVEQDVLIQAQKTIIQNNEPINYTTSMFETNSASYIYEAPLYLQDSDEDDLDFYN